MTRRHGSDEGSAFNANPDTGARGYRMEWEPPDSRPQVYYSAPFWQSSEEEAVWVRAVHHCPLSQYGALDVFAYLRAVGEVATGLWSGRAVQSMPRRGMSGRERDAHLDKLRGQVKEWGGEL